ncbi:hypothetical protein Rrhod_3039 [Rhodococcus rhodnii LMG 5362]|uniref:Uncharacterized protein n=1 Tax=Rhodococcus rhodnii LMG 5362 TaxID=1273125 RepID=R7WNI4_9NOCA|nr:hypothetical protein Rrhod_3039 [Rhodococcus rhodnii LMG 5362]
MFGWRPGPGCPVDQFCLLAMPGGREAGPTCDTRGGDRCCCRRSPPARCHQR